MLLWIIYKLFLRVSVYAVLFVVDPNNYDSLNEIKVCYINTNIIQYTKVLSIQIKSILDSFPNKAVEMKEYMIGILNV